MHNSPLHPPVLPKRTTRYLISKLSDNSTILSLGLFSLHATCFGPQSALLTVSFLFWLYFLQTAMTATMNWHVFTFTDDYPIQHTRAHTHTDTHTCTHSHTHPSSHAHRHSHVLIIYAHNTHIDKYTHIHTFKTHSFTQGHKRTHSHTYTDTYTLLFIHKPSYTHSHILTHIRTHNTFTNKHSHINTLTHEIEMQENVREKERET
jgi:hypothetical protein